MFQLGLGRVCQPFHARDCRHRGLDAEDAERPSQIVDERREAEFGAHVFAAPHQEGARVHPLLDGAEGVLDGLTAPGEDVRPDLQSVVER